MEPPKREPDLGPVRAIYHDPPTPPGRGRGADTIPRSLPDPVSPSGGAYDSSMVKQEREGPGQPDRSPGGPRRGPGRLPSIEEQSWLETRLESMSVNSPTTPTTPRHSRLPSMAAKARSLLLAGLAGADPPARRQSAAGIETHRPVRRGAHLLQHLHAQGRAHHGNSRTADIFVAAAALARRGGRDDEGDGKQLALRARVRPRAAGREPFVIQRTFELEALRATALTPVLPAARRLSEDGAARTPLPSMPRRCSGAGAHGPTAGLGAGAGEAPGPWRGGARGPDAVPLRKCVPGGGGYPVNP